MIDKLYIGDIPQEFHFARFSSSNYIDLYDTNVLYNGTYNFYRLYMYDNFFTYEKLQQTYGSYTTYYTTDIPVTNQVVYRRDFPSILFMTLAFVVVGIWLLNFMTNIVKRGGILGGLL